MKNNLYSLEEYQNILEKFFEDRPNYRMKLDKKEVTEFNIMHLFGEDLFDFIINKLCKKTRSLKRLRDMRNAISLFYDWCVKNGYIIDNILKQDGYEYEIFEQRFIDTIDLKVFYDDTIESLIRNLPDGDRLLLELIIRCAYEGVTPDINDFIRLKCSDIDYNSGTVTFKGNTKKVSEKLLAVFSKYEECYYTEDKQTHNTLYQYKDYILKTRIDNNRDEDNFYNSSYHNIFNLFTALSKSLGEKIDYRQIYISGFINFVKKTCDNLPESSRFEYLLKLFLGWKHENKKNSNVLKELAEQYGMNTAGRGSYETRSQCYLYFRKSKYCHD